MGVKRNSGLTAGYQASIFVNVVLICALGTGLAVGLVALVRSLSFHHDLRFDWNDDRRYALDDQTKDALRKLEVPVEIVFVVGYDQDIRMRVQDGRGGFRHDYLQTFYQPVLHYVFQKAHAILLEWRKVTPNVKIRLLEAFENTYAVETLAAALGRRPEEIQNRAIFSMGSRRREVPLRRMLPDMEWGFFPSSGLAVERRPTFPRTLRLHEELTAALRAISAGEPIPVGIVRGLDAWVEPGPSSEPGHEVYDVVSRILEAEGFRPEAVSLRTLDEIPPHIGALVIGGIRQTLDARSVAVLRKYEARGGRFLLVADPRLPENFSSLLEPYGCSLDAAHLRDARSTTPQRANSAEIESDELCVGPSPIVSPLRGRVSLYMGQCRPLTISSDKSPGAERIALLKTSEDVEVIPVSFDTGGRPDPRPAGLTRPRSRVTVAAQLVRPTSDGRYASRVVVFGGKDVLAMQELLFPTHWGNRDLLLNTMNWLTDREAALQLAPRPEVRDRVVSVPKLREPFFWVAVVGIPLLACVLSFTVMLARRD